MKQVSFTEGMWFWLKLGFISFGGPAGQIAIMHRELVEKRHWISERRFLHALNYCMILPGPEAQQLATYLGWLMHRTWGGIVAGGLFVLPSLLMLIALSWMYVAFGNSPLVAGLFYGIKPAVTAIVLHAAYRIGGRTLRNRTLMGIAIAAFVASLLKIPFPLIVMTAALVGFVGGRWWPERFTVDRGPEHGSVMLGPDLSDDHTPLHTQFRWTRLISVLVWGVVLWLLPMGSLVAVCGTEHPLTQMSYFFTTAALLTFGGAYAVLPYVYDGAVIDHGWLTSAQMIDGLALGETTPGPLIMVVAFVGFVGGYNKGVLGEDYLFWGGALAAVLTTWFTFLPSFILVFAGGPFVESTHGKLAITAPLTAIMGAVVGVIGSLGMFFALHVFWPQGESGSCDIAAVILTLIASVALFYFRRSVVETLFVAAGIGMAWQFLIIRIQQT